MEPTQIRHPVGTGSGTEPGRRDKAEKEKEPRGNGVLVIGLGRFGSSIALTLERLGHDVLAVVGVGTSLEASVLIAGNLVDLGTPQIWAKAISPEHSRILRRIGVHHVVLPEADAGNRVAHLVSGKLLDYIEVEDDFTIVKMRPPR